MTHNIYLDKCLKIKETSLADEIKRIKREIHKYDFAKEWLYPDDLKKKFGNRTDHAERYKQYVAIRSGLYHHYKNVVYVENRAAALARAYLKGRPYNTVEKPKSDIRGGVGPSNYMTPLFKRLCEIVAKYENIKSYHHKQHRRDIKDIANDVSKWLDA